MTHSSGPTVFNHLAALVFLLLISGSTSAHIIDPCYCNAECYTDEVTPPSCNNNRASFRSNGLPQQNHTLMVGIEASNQQFPLQHNYEFHINTQPKYLSSTVPTESGPIGVAVNGIPLFDPSTQGRVNPDTGKRPNTLDAWELDECGGHAGRGDDYHYHIAPKCLIAQLGAEHIEVKKRPIGFAMDGFPILALGWFDNGNDVESALDQCRGMFDEKDTYFYNVMHKPKWDILNCFHGQPQHFARDQWRHRLDKNNNELGGLAPIKFKISDYQTQTFGDDICHALTGRLDREVILTTSGRTKKIGNQTGSIFHCNSQCYGMFFEVEKKPEYRGRVMAFERITAGCPSSFEPAQKATFEAYEGPAVKYMGPQSTKK